MSKEHAEQALDCAHEALQRGQADAAIAQLSTAIRGFTAAGEPGRAAMACVELGETYGNLLGNGTAARAWFTRAARLVEKEPPCVEQGWVAIAPMGCEVDDPAVLLAAAELALDRARRFGDVNLETKAMADAGLAHVQAGRTAQGMALLEESMALACGPADDRSAAAKSVCSFFTACQHAADFTRANSWCGPLRQIGLIGPTGVGPLFLSSHCDSVHAAMLVELGRWGEAEAVLTRAVAQFEAGVGTPAWHPAIALADLHVRQGRLAEAETLLLGKDFAIEALLPAARLHGARGDSELAKATALRGLRALGEDRLRAIELWIVVVEAELALGRLDDAKVAADHLGERARGVGVPSLEARATLAQAQVLVALDRFVESIALLERVVDAIDPAQAPWQRALLQLELTRLREGRGERAAAAVEARAAVATLAPLDVVLDPADEVMLVRLGARPGPSTTSAATAVPGACLRRDDRWYTVSWAATHARLPTSKGLRYLAELLAHPTVERHALDLVDLVEGVDPEGLDRRALDRGLPALDSQACAMYRRRVEERRGAIEEMLARGRLEAAEAAQDELDALLAELARGAGMRGRERTTSSVAERARLNVTRAIRTAIAKIIEALPEAGAALDRRVRTGLYCAYLPAEHEISWSFSPD